MLRSQAGNILNVCQQIPYKKKHTTVTFHYFEVVSLQKQSPDTVHSCVARPPLLSETVSYTAASQWMSGLMYI